MDLWIEITNRKTCEEALSPKLNKNILEKPGLGPVYFLAAEAMSPVHQGGKVSYLQGGSVSKSGHLYKLPNGQKRPFITSSSQA